MCRLNLHQSEASILNITLINRRNRSKWGRGGIRALVAAYQMQRTGTGVNATLRVLLRIPQSTKDDTVSQRPAAYLHHDYSEY